MELADYSETLKRGKIAKPTCMMCGKDYSFKAPAFVTEEWQAHHRKNSAALCPSCEAPERAAYIAEGHTHITFHQFVTGRLTGQVSLGVFRR